MATTMAATKDKCASTFECYKALTPQDTPSYAEYYGEMSTLMSSAIFSNMSNQTCYKYILLYSILENLDKAKSAREIFLQESIDETEKELAESKSSGQNFSVKAVYEHVQNLVEKKVKDLTSEHKQDTSYCLSFKDLGLTFSKVCWMLTVKYGLHLCKNNQEKGLKSYLDNLLVKHSFKADEYVPLASIESVSSKLYKDVVSECSSKMKSNPIASLHNSSGGNFYGFNKSKGMLWLNPIIYDFLCDNQFLVSSANFVNLLIYLKEANPKHDLNNLPFNLDDYEVKRESLLKYKLALVKYAQEHGKDIECFYNLCPKCKKIFVKNENNNVSKFLSWLENKDKFNSQNSQYKLSTKFEKINNDIHVDHFINKRT